MKTLITGASGQLGRALAQLLPDAICTNRSQLDVGSANDVASFDWNGIQVVFNTAAYTNVDGAQTDAGRRLAWQSNCDGPTNLARECNRRGMTLVHISSDYVFDGSRPVHAETETFRPLSTYGRSKAAGDVVVEQTPRHYIIRTSWVIGEGKNFVRTMLGLASKWVSPRVVSDQIGRPTFTTDLAAGILHLVQTAAPYGTYNLTNAGPPVSWADLTRAIFSLVGREDLSVQGITTAKYFADNPQAAPRPLNSVLDLGKIKAAGFHPRDWRVALEQYIESLEAVIL